MEFLRLIKYHFIFSLFLIFAFPINARELPKYLMATPGIIRIDTLETTNFFKEKYMVVFKQYVDYKDPDAGFFEQRVFISHYSLKSPVVYVTEGYMANYAEASYYVEELASIYNANQIIVEHRYFGESVPDTINYDYLTTENAAGDHHAIYLALKNIYKSKWIASGISKGGETALLYNMYYPNDMNATVAYVAPIAFGIEDPRHGEFINQQVATSNDRKAVLNFQKEILKRKSNILPMFEKYTKKHNLTYRLSISEIFDYCVLEFAFSFWQWGANVSSLPTKKDSDGTFFQYFISISDPAYFSIEETKSTLSFFFQAAKELGYYAYDISPFEKLISINSTENYLKKIFLPENVEIEYIPETAKLLTQFMKTKAHNIVLVYGEYDPWSAAAADFGDNQSVLKVVMPAGSHLSRIKSLPKLQHDNVITTIANWIK